MRVALRALPDAATGCRLLGEGDASPPARDAGSVPLLEQPVSDVWFVLLTVGVFAILAAVVKGVEKL